MDCNEIARQFHEDGFVIVRGVFSRDEIAKLNTQIDVCVRDVAPKLSAGEVYYEDTPDRPVKSMFRLYKHNQVLASLLQEGRLLKIGRAVFNDPGAFLEDVMFFGKPARSGSVTPPHQDNTFQCWDPPESMVVTISIDPSTHENGALTCQKGTHKLGLLPHRPSGVMGFSQVLIEQPDTTEYPEVELHLNPGDICLHAVNTVHRSNENRTDKSRRQIAINCRSTRAKIDEDLYARRREIVDKLHAEKA